MLLNSLILAFGITGALCADLISTTEQTEFGAYVNPNPKNICEGEELETLTVCASEVLSRLDECKPDDLACECCALQSMKRDCYGLCPNTASGNFLAVLYDDCETMNDVNACNLPFKKHDAHIAKFLRPNARIPVEEKEPDFVIKSQLENVTHEREEEEEEDMIASGDAIDEEDGLGHKLHHLEVGNATLFNHSNTSSVYADFAISNKIIDTQFSAVVLLVGFLSLVGVF